MKYVCENLPPVTSVYGAAFQAILYAERAGFVVSQRGDCVVAFRSDLDHCEFHLRSTKPAGRFWWKRVPAR